MTYLPPLVSVVQWPTLLPISLLFQTETVRGIQAWSSHSQAPYHFLTIDSVNGVISNNKKITITITSFNRLTISFKFTESSEEPEDLKKRA